VTAGDTGAQLQVVDGSVPDGTVLHIRRLALTENPPAGVGSPWWCAELSIDGLPEGAARRRCGADPPAFASRATGRPHRQRRRCLAAVASIARNRILLRAVYAIRKQLRRQLELNLATGLRSHGQDKYTLGVQSHAELLDAIANHESERAEALVQRLVVGGQPEIAWARPPLTRQRTRVEKAEEPRRQV
jgi:hypothetical protein